METMTAAQYREMLLLGPQASAPSKKRATPEEDLQRACIEIANALERRRPLLKYLFHPANGGKRPKGEAGKMRAMGVKSGVPDLLLPMPSPSGQWPGMALELKGPDGRPSLDQEDWLETFVRGGWLTGLVWSVEDFQDYLDIFFG